MTAQNAEQVEIFSLADNLDYIEACLSCDDPQKKLLKLLGLKDISETESHIKRITVINSRMQETSCGYFKDIYNIGLILLALKRCRLEINDHVKSDFGISQKDRDIIKKYLGDLFCKKLEQSDAPYAEIVKTILASAKSSVRLYR